MDTLLGYLDVFLLVFVRMGALLFMNPVFSRKNVPMMARAGLVFSDVYKRQDEYRGKSVRRIFTVSCYVSDRAFAGLL